MKWTWITTTNNFLFSSSSSSLFYFILYICFFFFSLFCIIFLFFHSILPPISQFGSLAWCDDFPFFFLNAFSYFLPSIRDDRNITLRFTFYSIRNASTTEWIHRRSIYLIWRPVLYAVCDGWGVHRVQIKLCEWTQENKRHEIVPLNGTARVQTSMLKVLSWVSIVRWLYLKYDFIHLTYNFIAGKRWTLPYINMLDQYEITHYSDVLTQ